MKWKTAKRAEPSHQPVVQNAARCPHCQKLNFDLEHGENMCLRCGKDFHWSYGDAEVTIDEAEGDLLEIQANRTRGLV